MCTFQESLGLHLWQRDRDLSQGLNKQLWHSGGTLGAAPHLSRAAGGWRAGGVWVWVGGVHYLSVLNGLVSHIPANASSSGGSRPARYSLGAGA